MFYPFAQRKKYKGNCSTYEKRGQKGKNIGDKVYYITEVIKGFIDDYNCDRQYKYTQILFYIIKFQRNQLL